MTHRGILTKKPKRYSKDARRLSITSQSMLYLGVVILILSLMYMIANLAKADAIISIWLPLMITGIFLVVISHPYYRLHYGIFFSLHGEM